MSWITLLLLLSALARAQAPAVGDYTKLAVQGDYVVHDFKFHSGEKLPELRLHYAAWGTPRHNPAGEITNADSRTPAGAA
jgi:homoserine O-acetyltransferase